MTISGKWRLLGVIVVVFSLAVILVFITFGMHFPSLNKTKRFGNVTRVLNAEIHYVSREGRSPPLVFLHGFGASLSVWSEVIRLLKSRAIYALDLIGFGGSDRPRISYGLESQSDYVIAFLKEERIENAVLVGYSMGASIACTVAAKSPSLISGLVLIAPSGFPSSLQFKTPQRWIYRPGIGNRIGLFIVDSKLYDVLFPNSRARQILGITGSYDEKFRALLPSIKQKTLLLWSSGDVRVPFRYRWEYLKRIRNISFRELPEETGHSLKSASRVISVEINRFLDDLGI